MNLSKELLKNMKEIPEEKKIDFINLLIDLYKANDFGEGFGKNFNKYWSIRTLAFDEKKRKEKEMLNEEIVESEEIKQLKNDSCKKTGCYIYTEDRETQKEKIYHTYEFLSILPEIIFEEDIPFQLQGIYSDTVNKIHGLINKIFEEN